MGSLKDSYRALNGRTYRQDSLLDALRKIRLDHWLFHVDVEEMAKEALEDGWITSNGDGTFTFSVAHGQVA